MTEVTVRISHPMEAGDPPQLYRAEPKPALFLRQLTLQLNEKVVVEAQLGPSVSDYPRLSFLFNDLKLGDTFAATCLTNKGDELKGSATVSA